MATKSIRKHFLIFSLIASLTLLSTLYGTPSIPTPSSSKYVNDYVGLLNTNETTALVSLGQELESKTGAQAVIAIIPSTEGIPIEEYALRLFRSWGIGENTKDNGLLMLIALNDHTWRIEVGRGLEGAIPDALSNRVMESYASPNFANSNYGQGILSAYSVFADTIATEYQVTLTHSLHLQPPPAVPQTNYTLWIVIIGLVVGDLLLNRGRIFSSLLQIAFWSNLGGPRGPRGGGYGGGGFGGGSSNGGGSSGSW